MLQYLFAKISSATTLSFAFLKSTKIYLIFVGLVSWLLSTYNPKPFLMLFCLVTTIDTITKINAVAKNKGLKFNPFKKYFWFEIKSEGLKKMAKKIFGEYSVYIILAVGVDTWVFKNTLHFDILRIKLSIPTFAILFFTGIEIFSIFENQEEAGKRNWLKIGINRFSVLLPEKWQQIIILKPLKKDCNHEFLISVDGTYQPCQHCKQPHSVNPNLN